MSESKSKEIEDFKEGDESVAHVEITQIEVSPNPTELTNELNLEVDFALDQAIEEASWEIKYLVDSVQKRYIIILGHTDTVDYEEGANNFQFSVPSINVGDIKPSNLSNCGLLIATLKSKAREIMDLKMVIQVSKQGESFHRRIFSPLE